jgi:hypothetical protein
VSGGIHLIIHHLFNIKPLTGKNMHAFGKSKSTGTIVLTFLCVGFTLPAYGYIDPGTGSLIIQSIIGAIAAIGVTMKLYWHKIKVFFMSRKSNESSAATEEKAED